MEPVKADPAFDFNEWAALAQSDPEAFDRRRLASIEALMQGMGEARRQRLRGLQFRIDMERRRARTPLKACLRLSSMMWDSFHELNAALSRLTAEPLRRPRSAGREDRPAVRILPFQRPPGR
jgi:hypothetical protein